MPPSRALRILILIAAVLILLATMSRVALEAVPAWGWDASVYRSASLAMLSGDNPYEGDVIPRFAEGMTLATIPYYVYAPFFAALFAPLAALPPEWTLKAWFVANIAMLLVSSVLILRAGPGARPPASLLWAALAVALFPPVRTLLILGQSGAVMLLALALSLHFAQRGHPFRSGLALSFAFFKPHLVLLLPFLALRRQWRTLAGFGAGAALLNLPFAFWMDDWFGALVRTRDVNLSYGCLPFSSGQALLRCVLGDSPAGEWAVLLGLALLGLASLVLVRRSHPAASSPYRVQAALVVVLGLLVLDNVRVADLVLLLLPFHLLGGGDALPAEPWPRRACWILLGSAYVIPYAAMVAFRPPNLGSLPVWYSLMSVLVYAGLAIALVSRTRLAIKGQAPEHVAAPSIPEVAP